MAIFLAFCIPSLYYFPFLFQMAYFKQRSTCSGCYLVLCYGIEVVNNCAFQTIKTAAELWALKRMKTSTSMCSLGTRAGLNFPTPSIHLTLPSSKEIISSQMVKKVTAQREKLPSFSNIHKWWLQDGEDEIQHAQIEKFTLKNAILDYKNWGLRG